MTYPAALSFSWALTWRLACAHLVLLLILSLLLLAFLSPARQAHAAFIGGGDLLLGWVVAWPFVIRRVLAPQAFLPRARSQALRVRYGPSVLLGFACDLLSLTPVAGALLLTKSVPILLAVFLLTRMLAVLPLGIQTLARQITEIA